MDTIVGLTAFITGAPGGIGPFIARALARERMNLVLVDKSALELEHLTTKLRAEGIIVMSVPAEVTNLAAMERIFSSIKKDIPEIIVNPVHLIVKLFFPSERSLTPTGAMGRDPFCLGARDL